jgi:hypothetical protein
MRVNQSALNFNLSSVFNVDVSNVVSDINMGLGDKSTLDQVKQLISQFIPSRVANRELYEIFLLDLFLHGQVRGSSVYREIARVYKRKGLIEIKARGKYSVYRLKPEYLFIHERIREILSGLPTKLLQLPHHTPQENNPQ